MKFIAQAHMRSHPDFRVTAKMHPVDFELGADGGLEFVLGAIAAHSEAIPLTITIPFLRRGAGVQAVGSIGPFGLRLGPVEGSVRTAKFRLGGTLGKEGMNCRMEGDVGCETECDIKGTVPGKTGRISLEMGDGDDPHRPYDHAGEHGVEQSEESEEFPKRRD